MTVKKLSTRKRKFLLEYRKANLALKQVRGLQLLLTEAGVPEFVTVCGLEGNAAQIRLKWFLARRKDVSQAEKDLDPPLTKEEREAISMLVPFGAK